MINKLSVILPTIRLDRLRGWYDSFLASYSGEHELLLIGPYAPDWIAPGVLYCEDWGHPVRCQQRALLQCTGDLIHRAVDDSLYRRGALDAAMSKLTDDYRTVVALKYTETNASVDRTHKDFQDMNNQKYYTIGYHLQAGMFYVPVHYKLLNFGLIPRKMMMEIGGWDCNFESVAIAELDLAIRLQRAGATLVLSDDIVVDCDWMPGHQGDHGPMHDAFGPDMEKYKVIYNDSACERRITVDPDNWKLTSPKWERRFGR